LATRADRIWQAAKEHTEDNHLNTHVGTALIEYDDIKYRRDSQLNADRRRLQSAKVEAEIY
jgi:hypothetical protein